jgi:hypothetical protein
MTDERSSMTHPLHGAARYTVITIGIVVSVVIAAAALPWMTSPRGAVGPTILQAHAPVSATIALTVCFLGAAVVAGLVGRFTNAVVGMFVFGCATGAAAFGTIGTRELAFTASTSITMLAVEAIVLAALMLACALLIFRIAGPLSDIEPDDTGRPGGYFSPASFKAAAWVLVVLAGVWFIAQTPMRGQALLAIVAGAMFASLGARLTFLGAQPLLLYVATCVVGAIGYVAASFMLDGALDAAFVDDRTSALLHVMPLDYLGGAVIGISLGLGWAKSFVHEHSPNVATA